MIVDLLAYLAAAVALLAAGVRIWTTRGRVRQGEVWTLCLGGGLLALAAVLMAPASATTLTRLQRTAGVDLAKLVGDALRMACAGAAGLLATQIRDERAPSSRAWLRGLAAVEVLLVCLFLGAGFRTVDGGSHVRADRVPGALYDTVRLAYPILALGLFLVAIWPHARALPPGSVRAGSRILAGAAVVGIAWTSWTVDDIVELARTGRQNLGDDAPSAVLEALFIVAVGTGMTVTFWEGLVDRPLTWFRALRSYRAMAPLWEALCDPRSRQLATAPDGRTAPVSTTPVLAERLAVRPWRAGTARYRRVIEIRDAQLSLRPYLFGASAGGWSPADEAAAVVAGLKALQSGSGPVPAPVGEHADSVPVAGAAVSIDAEAQRLVAVARAFVRARRDASVPA